jgi:hypothetical protein
MMLILKDPRIRFKKNQKFPIKFRGEGVCPVKANDKVDPSTVLFEGSQTNILQSIDLPKELAISPDKARKYILKSEGEIVEEGDILARRTVSLGIMEKLVRSEFEGKVSFERLDKGILDIMAPSRESVMTAGMHGRVAHVMPSDKNSYREVVLKVDGLQVNAAIAFGEKVSANLALLKNGNSVYRASDVTESFKGKIVVAGRHLNVKLYEALIEAGVKGIIAGGVASQGFNIIREKSVPTAILEGWGVIPINNVVIDMLRHYENAPVLIDSSKNKIFVYPAGDGEDLSKNYLNDDFSYMLAANTADIVEACEDMKVQIWDEPFWGYSGKIVDVLNDDDLINIELSTGSKVLVEPQLVRVVEN